MTGDAVETRPARPEDAVALSGLLDELGHPAPPDVVAQRLVAMVDAGELVLVAVRGGRVVGFVAVHVTSVLHRPTPVGRLTALCVTGSERARGVGRALVAAAERHLRAAGCALIEVTSNRRRTEAHAIYQRLGYTLTSYRFYRELTDPDEPR